MIRLLFVVMLAVQMGSGSPPQSPPCNQYGCPPVPPPRTQPYVPAPPGKAPNCAKHGHTYCEHIDQYPTYLVQYLAERWMYDYNTLFSNERRETYRPPIVYGPPTPTYQYKPVPKHVQQPAITPHGISPLINSNYNQTQVQNGYPDRRYPLGNPQQFLFNDDPGYIYSALLQPNVTPYDPNQWWKRYSSSGRNKRQSGITTLCPTFSQYVMPRAAVNNEGNWKYVVNLDQNQRYTQMVKSETCISSQCNGICSLPNGYTSSCTQQYVQKRLVALDGNGERLYTDIFWFPHCCVCQIRLAT